MKRIMLLAIIGLTALPLVSQEKQENPAPPKPPRHFYRLNYVLKETDEGKVVNQRSFSLTSSDDHRFNPRLRAGSRLPVGIGDNKTSYIDVGVNLDSQLEETPEGLVVEVTAEISSPAPDSSSATSASPAIRQIRTNALAIVALNKPTVLFSVDDPSSRHRFELEVTAAPQH